MVYARTSSLSRRASETWNNLPEIGNSKWGFIGVIAGVGVVVILIIVIAIACCCKRSKKNKRMRRASHGNDLPTFHPTPTTGGLPASHRTKFAAVRTNDYNEEDVEEAFMARSPRESFAYDNGRTAHKHGLSYDSHYGKPSGGYPYHASEADENPYMRSYNYSGHGQSQSGYGHEQPASYYVDYSAPFAEPQYVQDGATRHTPAPSSVSYAQSAATTPAAPSMSQMTMPSHKQQLSQQQAYAPSTYPQQQHADEPIRSPTSPRHSQPFESQSPAQAHGRRAGSGVYAPSVAETAPPAYIPYAGGAGAASSARQQVGSPIMAPAFPPSKERSPYGADV